MRLSSSIPTIKIGMYSSMVITYSKGKDQPDKVVNPARVRLLIISILRLNIWCLLTGFLPISAAASMYISKTAMRHGVSPELIGSRNCVTMAFTAESPLAQDQ